MMKNLLLCVLLLNAAIACGQKEQMRSVGGPCENCDLIYEGMPAELTSRTALTSEAEPGEPMEISGVVYETDGRTPAEGVIIYVYHTDARGEYAQPPGGERRMPHGRLRGWVKTDSKGRYSFRTIRPASYPNSRAPQHIHPIVKEPGLTPYWIDEYVFDDDPYLDENYIKNQQARGGSGVLHLVKDRSGTWTGKRDILLGKNVPGYTP